MPGNKSVTPSGGRSSGRKRLMDTANRNAFAKNQSLPDNARQSGMPAQRKDESATATQSKPITTSTRSALPLSKPTDGPIKKKVGGNQTPSKQAQGGPTGSGEPGPSGRPTNTLPNLPREGNRGLITRSRDIPRTDSIQTANSWVGDRPKLTRMKVVILGYGNIARGIVAPIFRHQDWDIVFVDADRQHPPSPPERKPTSYNVTGPGSNTGKSEVTTVRISDYRMLYYANRGAISQEIQDATFVFCTVLRGHVQWIIPALSDGLALRLDAFPKLVIIDCEHRYVETMDLARALQDYNNGNNHKWKIVKAIANQRTGRPRGNGQFDSVRVEWLDGLSIQSENGILPPLMPQRYVTETSRLPIHTGERQMINVAQAIIAYYSHYYNVEYISRRLADRVHTQEIKAFVRQALSECVSLLLARHELHPDNASTFVGSIMARVYNQRVYEHYLDAAGYGPLTTLRDTLLPTLSCLAWYDLPLGHLVVACKLALGYQDVPGDVQSADLGSKMRTRPAENVVQYIADSVPLATVDILQGQFLDAVKAVKRGE